LPQDVQAEAFDYPEEFLQRRVWQVARPEPESQVLNQAVGMIRNSEKPVIVAGGGVVYSDATAALHAFVRATGIPVGETQAGKGALPYDNPAALGAIGATGTAAANAIGAEADLVIGIGTRWSDFTTASHSVFKNPNVRFININIAAFDSIKLGGLAVTADARQTLLALTTALADYRVSAEYRENAQAKSAAWQQVVDRCYSGDATAIPSQPQVLGAVNSAAGPGDVVINAAGSMPGDLHKLWRAGDPLEYHVEYGFSCMGYEIAGGLGVKLGDPAREVFVMVGDGSYLMLAQELVTAVQESVKLVVVLVQNHGYASIGSLSESVGSQRFGTSYRFRNVESHQLDGEIIPVDLAANAASLGADVIRAGTLAELRTALEKARESTRTTVIHVETTSDGPAPETTAWWDVPVAEVATLESTRAARADYERNKGMQRHYL
jgi:3D-(3,5/4)-trihydroxycyclohexane-1,2-dione acylhydrolase (decyclizing)